MQKSHKKILFYVLILFASFSAATIGLGWDEEFLINQGKVTANYLLSLGLTEPNDIFRREFYSPIYYSLRYLLVQIVPHFYQIEAGHLVNLFFSMTAIVGTKKISEELFNKEVGNYVFLVLFFFPAFFGHMGFNSKDTIIAFCHVWIFFYVIKYIKSHNENYIYKIAVLSSVGTGINLFFLGSLLPLFFFTIVEIFFIKKFNSKNIEIILFLKNLLKGLLIFYSLLIIFWIDTHPNVFILPFKYINDWMFSDLWRGYPFILINGNYYLYSEIPKSYLLINLFYRTPEYILITYLIFVVTFTKFEIFFSSKIKLFNYKLLLIFSMILYPFVLLYFTPFSIYDGLRHVLWMLPYVCIIVALIIYFITQNLKQKIFKFFFLLTFLSIIYFLFNFLIITPYQYTYLNIFAGSKKNNYTKFENDYWGGSIKELINKINFDKNKKIKLSTCGVNSSVPKYYLKKYGFTNFEINKIDNSDYIIMTNRAVNDEYNKNNLTTCFDKHKGEEIFYVKRNGLTLSSLRKLQN